MVTIIVIDREDEERGEGWVGISVWGVKSIANGYRQVGVGGKGMGINVWGHRAGGFYSPLDTHHACR